MGGRAFYFAKGLGQTNLRSPRRKEDFGFDEAKIFFCRRGTLPSWRARTIYMSHYNIIFTVLWLRDHMLPPRIHWLEVTSLSTRFSGVGGPSRKSKQSQDSQAKWVLAERSDDKHKTDKDVVNNRLLVWRLGGGFPYFLFSPPIWGKFPFWLIVFKWVGSTTNWKS